MLFVKIEQKDTKLEDNHENRWDMKNVENKQPSASCVIFLAKKSIKKYPG